MRPLVGLACSLARAMPSPPDMPALHRSSLADDI